MGLWLTYEHEKGGLSDCFAGVFHISRIFNYLYTVFIGIFQGMGLCTLLLFADSQIEFQVDAGEKLLIKNVEGKVREYRQKKELLRS